MNLTTPTDQAPAAPYVWTTQTGERIPVTKMRTSHLFYTVRMIFNHTCPLQFRISGCKRYELHLDTDERCAAVVAMLAELSRRLPTELEEWQWCQLAHMAKASRMISVSQLTP